MRVILVCYEDLYESVWVLFLTGFAIADERRGSGSDSAEESEVWLLFNQ